MEFVRHLISKASQFVNRMDFNNFVLIMAFVIAIGFLCMRGFGSRSNY